MKLQHFFLLCLFLLCQSGGLRAQTSIFDALAKSEPGKGSVTILQSPAVRGLVSSQTDEVKIETDGSRSYLTASGYSIQVFMGNNQRVSRDEALSKKEQIDKLFSDIATYVDYTPPFWRLRAGDFMTYEEALCVMYRLAASFPSFRREIKIIREDIRIFIN
jgi:hypothetical protein